MHYASNYYMYIKFLELFYIQSSNLFWIYRM